jgi:hypothetical protein
MSVVEIPRVHITYEVFDFMFLCIDEPGANEQSLKFTIVNSKGIAVRKGTMRGRIVQLRLSHLREGEYQLSVSNGDHFYSHQQFVKRNCRNGEYTCLVF